MYSTEEKKRMAGSDQFQANLQNSQSDKEYDVRTAPEHLPQSLGGTMPQGDAPKKDPQEQQAENLKDKYVRSIEIKERASKDIDREVPDGLDPDLVKEVMKGGDWGNKDMRRYEEAYDKKYGNSSSSTGGGNTFQQPSNQPTQAQASNQGKYGNIDYNGPTFADKAIQAAANSNPVDFKALDQRIHDRPLYSQAQADIKHSEVFGDTWSWDSAPSWNLDRFKPGEQENRYEDVMKDNKYD